ncbi:MAG: cytochrome bc complex cytochrome b subunit [Thermoplasmata archaeon]|nr:cytochrome bc complex cytochrome b subunit [Candidatus Sysuiplasma acidicola]
MAEKNEYNPLNLTKQEEAQKGAYSISFLPVTRKELRIDYWTGAFLATALIYQIATGILLAYYYEPGSPYSSTLMIMGVVPFGEVLLTSHLFMAYAMVAMVYIHMFRQYFIGAYRGKWRWMQWIIGVIIFLLVNTIAAMGYMLTYSVQSVLGLHVSEILLQRSIIGRLAPGLAGWLTSVIVGNGTTVQSWQHLLILHAAILSIILLILVFIHFFLYEKSGPYDPSARPDEEKIPWFPMNLLYTAFIGMIFVAGILIASALMPQGLPPAYGQLVYGTTPFPDWYEMPVYKLMDVAGFGLSTGGVPLVFALLLFLMLVPFIDRYRENGPLERPMITFMGVFIILFWLVVGLWGYAQPGLSQTRPLTLFMLYALTFCSLVPVYAMRHAKRDLGAMAVKRNE